VKWAEQNVIFRDSLVKAMGKLKFEEVIQLWWATSEMRGFHSPIMLDSE
jgi:hypothetical protein